MSERPPPRLRQVDRQRLIPTIPLEGLIDSDHQARVVWDFCLGMDLSPLYDAVGSREGGPGHPAIDPRIQVALWLYATLEGVGSARALARLCADHAAFRWIAGGVSVNHHTLADFRVGDIAWLDGLLTHSVAVLREQGLVDLNRVAQDGMRVRASAGAASFHRKATLEEHLEEAKEQVARLKEEMDDDPSAPSRRHAAARERAARERQERLERALARMPEMEAKKKPDEKDKARASSTDPDIPRFFGEKPLLGWKAVDDKVHADGGVMAPQLWHMGVVAPKNSSWLPPGSFEGPSGYVAPGKIGGVAMTAQDNTP